MFSLYFSKALGFHFSIWDKLDGGFIPGVELLKYRSNRKRKNLDNEQKRRSLLHFIASMEIDLSPPGIL